MTNLKVLNMLKKYASKADMAKAMGFSQGTGRCLMVLLLFKKEGWWVALKKRDEKVWRRY